MPSKRHDGDGVIVVRAARSVDVDRLASLCERLGYPASPEHVQRRLAQIEQDEDQAVFVAERVGGQVLGWVHVFGRQLLVVDRHAELGGLVVDEGHRGQGVGRLLMGQAEGWARAKGCAALYVRSNIVRTEAHRFYKAIGYDQIKTSCVFLKELESAG